MNCGRRSAVDDVRSRRTRAVDEDRRRIRWVVDEDRHRKRWTVDDDRRQRRMAVDDDRRHEPLWVAQVLQSLDRMDDLCVKFMHSVERTMSRSATIPSSSLLCSPNTHEQPTQLQRDPSVADFDFMEENQFTMSRPDPPSPPTQTEPHLTAAALSLPAAADQDLANQTPAATTAADLEMPTAAGDQAFATPAADSPTRRKRDLSPNPKSSHASVQATLQIPSPALTSAAQPSSPIHRTTRSLLSLIDPIPCSNLTQKSSETIRHSNTARLDLPATGILAGELPDSIDILRSEPQPENPQRDAGMAPENSVDIDDYPPLELPLKWRDPPQLQCQIRDSLRFQHSNRAPPPPATFSASSVVHVLSAQDISCKEFSGEIPKDIGKLQSIQKLSLAGNDFSGPLPDSIGDVDSVRSLDMSQKFPLTSNFQVTFPYPEIVKLLAKQTGLSRNQVSNGFINTKSQQLDRGEAAAMAEQSDHGNGEIELNANYILFSKNDFTVGVEISCSNSTERVESTPCSQTVRCNATDDFRTRIPTEPLKELNASPEHTVVYEDSMSGVKTGVDSERRMHPIPSFKAFLNAVKNNPPSLSSFKAFLDAVKTKRQSWSDHEMDAIHSLQLLLRGTVIGIENQIKKLTIDFQMNDPFLKQYSIIDRQQKDSQLLRRDLQTVRVGIEFIQINYLGKLQVIGKHMHLLTNAASSYHTFFVGNKKFYNQVHNLKGSIWVYCHARPLLPREMNTIIVGMHRGHKIFDPGGLLMFHTTISLSMMCLDGVELFDAVGE
ncbi:hypothetical protein KFK09_025677 [Dendrobium nobile]|uniref:Uncharacterized protein n=1 Tax=Dendrobium nobile TaxID=94219 RepID=A0A8T3A4G9_DENNO|nr:hypothetical protein KFK09_025677 [Dendrobium nobile]